MKALAHIVLIVACTATSLSAQQTGAASASELAARLKRAVEQRDTAGVAALVYWGKASAEMRASFLSHMTMESGAIETAAPTPLGANEISEYVRDGVTYRTTLQPVGHISLKYPKTAGQTMAVEPVYGAKDGRFFLVTAEPVTKTGGA